jgi:hypothetical protein
VKSQLVRITRPGFEFLPQSLYDSQIEDKKRKRAHTDKEYTQDGVKGMLCAEEQVTTISFEEVMSANIHQKIKLGDGLLGGGNEASTTQIAIANTFFPAGGNASDAMATSMSSILNAACSEGQDTPNPPLALKATAPLVPKAPPPSPGKALLPDEPPQTRNFFGREGMSGGASPESLTIPEDTVLPAPKAKTRGGSSGSGGGGGGGGPPKPKHKPQDIVRSRGRPQKDLCLEVAKMQEYFSASDALDPNYWGSEARTLLKEIAEKKKAIEKRIKEATEHQLVDAMHIALKRLIVIEAIVQTVMNHGMDSDEFQKCFDFHATAMNLDTEISVDFPPHIRWARYKLDARMGSRLCSFFFFTYTYIYIYIYIFIFIYIVIYIYMYIYIYIYK